ncbi:hypothetical protein CRUP_015863, partial [Coryphaenoides rupestris]
SDPGSCEGGGGVLGHSPAVVVVVVVVVVVSLCSPECKCGPLDLAFIVDSSESIGASNFALAKDFIITVIDRLMKDEQIKYSLDHMINNMKRENRVVLVLTDGRSDISRDKVPLNTLCGKGIRVGGLGVKDYSGRQPNKEQLGEVVCQSDPKPGFSIVLNNFAELLDDTFLQNLMAQICQVSFQESTDILLMMDSSASVGHKNFDTSKAFSSRLAERFLTGARRGAGGRGSPTVRVATAQYSRSSRLEQDFTSNLTQLALRMDEADFQNDGTDVTEAIRFSLERFGARGGRGSGGGRGDGGQGTAGSGQGGARNRKLVLFSDGRSQGITQAVLEKRVRELADGDVELFVVAVGSQVNEANLRTLVSRGRPDDITYSQRHLFRLADYPSLLRGVFHQTVSRRISLARSPSAGSRL